MPRIINNKEIIKQNRETAALRVVLKDFYPELLAYDLGSVKYITPDFVFPREGLGFEITELSFELNHLDFQRQRQRIRETLEKCGITNLRIHLIPKLPNHPEKYRIIEDEEEITPDNYLAYLSDFHPPFPDTKTCGAMAKELATYLKSFLFSPKTANVRIRPQRDRNSLLSRAINAIYVSWSDDLKVVLGHAIPPIPRKALLFEAEERKRKKFHLYPPCVKTKVLITVETIDSELNGDDSKPFAPNSFDDFNAWSQFDEVFYVCRRQAGGSNLWVPIRIK